MIDSDDTVTIDERYTSAIVTSNLRDEANRLGVPADLLKAAALSNSIVGSALKRLRGEWDGCSLTKKLDQAGINRLARDLAIPRTGAERTGDYAAMRAAGLSHPDAQRAVLTSIVDPKRAKDAAEAMHLHELGLILMRLKSLSATRLMVARQAEVWKITDPLEVATAVLFWWLSDRCDTCGGTKIEVSTEGKPTGRACKACKGTGKKHIPHGEAGRRVANYLDNCSMQGTGAMQRRLGRAK